ncbi:ribosomal protein S18 [Exophiala mesophila]|uniref:Small ribosomal subunit protein bS18m n=1 Tax=Exophiala mesophila TaxID=212818 RepID=A0A0D1ZDT6_EXOME|nr:ribosomal protein S18 [Exophiala mesophila]KIV92084.1 ribosomal protein S18 [Exophiala mesophila]
MSASWTSSWGLRSLSSALPRVSQPCRSLKLTQPTSRHVSTPNIASFNRQVALDAENTALKRLITRRWQVGDVYAPHDLSPAETRKWARRNAPSYDPFDKLNINPLSLYKNFTVMSDLMTTAGRILHSKRTGLRPVNQRKIAKAIRRAIALGLMPSTHQHPQYLVRTARNNVMNGPTDARPYRR